MPPKRPAEAVLFTLEIKKVNGHHHMTSVASPRARFLIAVGLAVLLGNSGVGLAEKVAQAAAWVASLSAKLP